MAFPGGSAWAWVRDIAEGYFLLTERPLKQMASPDLDKFQFEVDRRMRDIRSEQPSLDDIPAIQAKNRKIQRLQSALVILQAFRAKNRK
ncbi:MAG TPA: hypothetical protein VF017_07235 [Thermoanaerobaculia bacterium]|nr:hypothetical protein [Thermoanaerobaculia bacterium]